MRLFLFILLLPFCSLGQQWSMWPGTGSGGFTPPTANQVYHYDASNSASITIATGVSQWNDLSGNGHHLIQANTAKQPTYTGSGTTSVVTFDGTDDVMYVTPTFTLNQPFTIYIVMKQVTYTSPDYIFDGGTFTSAVLYQNTTSPNVSMYAGAVGPTNTNLTVATYKIVTCVFNNASSTLSVNDGTKATGTTGAAAAGGLTLGGGANLTSSQSNIGVQEMYGYSVADGSTAQTDMYNYLKAKWGL